MPVSAFVAIVGVLGSWRPAADHQQARSAGLAARLYDDRGPGPIWPPWEFIITIIPCLWSGRQIMGHFSPSYRLPIPGAATTRITSRSGHGTRSGAHAIGAMAIAFYGVIR